MTAQVIKLNVNYVYDDIMEFINLAHHSKNTRTSYEKGIRDFFRVIKKKEIEHLDINDLDIKKKDVERFRSILQGEGFSNSTINNKVAGVRKLYYELVANEYKLNVDFFKAIKKLNENTNSYGFFTEDEIFKLIELAKNEKRKGLIKSLFLSFCAETCIRKEAALQVKWSDFTILNNNDVGIIAVDKGDKEYKAVISYDFYKELLKIKCESDKVFDLTVPTVDAMMLRLKNSLNIDPSRNLTFHSLRKTGVNYKFEASGRDIKVAQVAANHSDKSLNVTIGTYTKKDDFGKKGLISKQYEKSDDFFNNLNLEEIKELLNSLDENTKVKINNKTIELFGNKYNFDVK